MAELPEELKRFITRDLIYFVGGGSVVTSFLYRFDQIPCKDVPIAFYLLGAGIAYVVGYALQDIFSVMRIVTTARVPTPGRLSKCLYRRFTRKEWKDISKTPWEHEKEAIKQARRDKDVRAEHERIITLMMIGTTMGPCGLLTALLMFWKWYISRSYFDLTLALAILAFSIVLVILGRLKVCQLTQYEAETICEYQIKESSEPNSSNST